LGSGWLDLVHPDDQARYRGVYGPAIERGEPFQFDYRLRRHDGEYRWLLAHAVPLAGPEGAVSGYIGSCVDITDRKRHAEALQQSNEDLTRANRELEEFAYVSSHDLQEPLRMVNIYAHLLVRKFAGDNEEARKYAGFISKGVQRMEDLLRDLLSYSRVIHADGGAGSTADLSESLSQAVEMLKTRMDELNPALVVDRLPNVRGDAAQLAHVFQNLLSNSFKYRSPDKRPEIQITANSKDGRWVIGVRDNGIGFQQEYAERIFGLFKRLHKDEYPGTGLGLAICQRIVERYGGRMWAESRPGEGAAFYFSLLPAEAAPS
jgi:light-regulated signal transduction histidine kinase (bacteriophytochrome)